MPEKCIPRKEWEGFTAWLADWNAALGFMMETRNEHEDIAATNTASGFVALLNQEDMPVELVDEFSRLADEEQAYLIKLYKSVVQLEQYVCK